MSVRTDTVNLIVNVNGNQAQNNLNNLRKKASDITVEMRGLTRGTAEYIAKSNELKAVTAQMDALKKQIGITSLSQKELTAELNKLKALRGSVVPFSEEFNGLTRSITAVESRLYDVRNGTQGFTSFLSKLSDGVKQFGVVAAAYLGFQFITSQFTNMINGAGKLSDQLADLQRVAGLTAEEAGNLNNKFKELNTRTSTEGLRQIAIIAGKLGVAKGDIFDFTAAVDKLVVSLGDELGNADQITTQLGKILNVFDGKITADGITKLGNAFVELANTGSATGGFIADFDQRLSGIAKSAGIGLGALSGLGAGLEEMGERVESSSTSIQKLVISINADIPKAAKIAGQSMEEFDKLLKIDPTEALLKYSQGLVKNKSSFAEVTASLKDAGEEGARTITTITKLGTGADLLRKRIDLGKTSIQETTAITEAFNLKNETFGATIDKLGKEFNKFASSPGLTGFLQGAVQGALNFIQVLKGIPKFIDDNSTALKLLATGIALLNYSYIKSAAVITYETSVKLLNLTITKGQAIVEDILTRAKLAASIVTEYLTTKMKLATAAQQLWQYVMNSSLGPLGILLTLIGAGIVAYNVFTGATERLTAAQRVQEGLHEKIANATIDEIDKIKTLSEIVKSSATSYDTKKKAINELIALNPEYLKGLTVENFTTGQGITILDNYIKLLKEKAAIEATGELRKEKMKEQTQAEFDVAKLDKKIEKTGVGGALVQGVLDNFGAGTFAQYDKAKKKVSELKEDILMLDKIVEDNIKKNPNAVLSTVSQLDGNAVTASNGKTLEMLKKQKSDLEAAYEKINITDKNALQKNADERKKLQAQIDSIEGKESSGEKKSNAEHIRLVKDAEKLQQDLLNLKQRALIKGEEPEQAEVDAVKAKYAKLTADALDFYNQSAIDEATHNADEKLIAEAQGQELQNIFEKYLKQRIDKNNASQYEDALAANSDFSNQLKENAAKDYADGALTKKQYNAEIKQIDKDGIADRITVAQQFTGTVKKAEKDLVAFKKEQGKITTADAIEESEKRKANETADALAKAQRNVLTARPSSDGEFEAKKALLKLQMDQELEAKDLTDEELLLRQAEFNKSVEELDRERVDMQIKNVMDYVDAFVNALTKLNQILSNKDNAEFNKEKIISNNKKKLYKDQLDNKLISKAQYDKKTQLADDELDKKDKELKLKQAKREKALNIFSAIVNTAGAIVKSLNSPPPGNIALAVLAGIAGALEIAAIATAPLPVLGTGDWLRSGDKHTDKSGGIPVVIERDEAVMKAAAMTSDKKYTVTGTTAQITSALNSAAGGTNWASGALVEMPKWATEKPATLNPNLPRIMEQGGIVRPLSQTGNQVNSNAQIEALLAKQNQLLQEHIDVSKEKANSLYAVVSIREFDKTRQLYEQAKKASGIN